MDLKSLAQLFSQSSVKRVIFNTTFCYAAMRHMVNQVSLRAYNSIKMTKELFPPFPRTHLHYIIFFNIVHIPDKPGQSHNTQDFESTLSEVRFLFTVPGC